MAYCSIGPHPSALLFHHHWRCWQEEDHIQPFHNFHPVLARTWKPPEFIKSCLGGNPTTLPQEPWIWSLDNLSLSRKWMEMFGEQPLLTNQQLSLIPIGWFPDNSILRRTRSMIKPRSQPSHFELQAEAQPGNFEGKTYSRSSDSFSQLNGQSMLPVTPMASVTKPATIDRGSKVGEITDPISSTETPQPTVRESISSSIPSTPRCSTRSTKGVPPVRYTPSKKWMDYSGCFVCARVQWKV